MSLLYAAPEVAQPNELAALLNSSALVKGGRGRSSIAYKVQGNQVLPLLGADPSQQPSNYCIKRVTIEDQVAPHDVLLELRLLKRMQGKNVPRLLGAAELAEDILTTNVSLLMGWYDVELATLLDDAWFVPASLTVPAGLGAKPGDDAAGHSVQVDKYVGFVQHLGQQLFDGLTYLHDEVHIAHRDIKPTNLMLAFESGSDVYSATLKIIDFGTAADLEAKQGDQPRCHTAQVGTASFRAPELLFAPTDGYDPRKIDVWAAGCVLAMLYTGFKRDEPPPMPRWADDSESEDDWRNPAGGPGLFGFGGPLGGAPKGLPPWMSAPKKRELVFGERVQRLHLFQTEVVSDIPLAGSIFALKGLPDSLAEWPEGATFQPPLDRLPFTRGKPKPVSDRLPIAQALPDNALVSQHLDAIERCTQLSAGRRVTAREANQLFT